MTARRLRALAGAAAFWAVAGLLLVYTLFPCYWAVVSAVQPPERLFAVPVAYWPAAPTGGNFARVLGNEDFLIALLNSTLVCAGTVGLSLAIGTLAAFALGRIAFRGRRAMLHLVLAMTMFPQVAALGGLYAMINALGLYNRLPALVFSYMLFTLPFTIWVLVGFFEALPVELEEAATVDGATPLQTFFRVLLPLVAPGLVTTGLLAFVMAWNEFLFALSFVQTPDRYTVTRALSAFHGVTGSAFERPWGQLMAATVIVTVPLAVLVLAFQRRIVAGLTGGAVKG